MDRKIVINSNHGAFGLSDEACIMYLGKKYDKDDYAIVHDDVWNTTRFFLRGEDFRFDDIARDDPVLVEVVETLGNRAERSYSRLKVIAIPEDVDWEIEDSDGWEHVAEKHRCWY